MGWIRGIGVVGEDCAGPRIRDDDGVCVTPKRDGSTGPDDARQVRPESTVVEPVRGLGGGDEVDAGRGQEVRGGFGGGLVEGDITLLLLLLLVSRGCDLFG